MIYSNFNNTYKSSYICCYNLELLIVPASTYIATAIVRRVTFVVKIEKIHFKQ